MQKALQTTVLPTLIMEDIFQQFQEQGEKIHCAFFQYQVQITPYILPTLVNKTSIGIGREYNRNVAGYKKKLVQ